MFRLVAYKRQIDCKYTNRDGLPSSSKVDFGLDDLIDDIWMIKR